MSRTPAAASWDHADGHGGGARFLDVPGISGVARVRWSTRVRPQYTPDAAGFIKPAEMLLATPQALVTHHAVLDPDSGAPLLAWPEGPAEAPLAILGETLILGAHFEGVVGRTLDSAKEVWRASRGSVSAASHADGLLVVIQMYGVEGYRMSGSGVPEPLWSVPNSVFRGDRAYAVHVVSRFLVAVITDQYQKCVLLDGATGEVLPFGNEVTPRFGFGDADAFVGWERQHGMEWGLYGLDRRRRFTLAGMGVLQRPLALTPDLVVDVLWRPEDQHCAQCSARAGGAVRSEFTLPISQLNRDLVAVRDGMYAWRNPSYPALHPHEVWFVRYDGHVAWAAPLDVESYDDIVAIAPLAHRLYVLTQRGSVFCLEPDGVTRRS